MNKLKRFKIGLFTITLGMVLVGASFALADDKAVAEGIILPEELNETAAILTSSVKTPFTSAARKSESKLFLIQRGKTIWKSKHL